MWISRALFVGDINVIQREDKNTLKRKVPSVE
jgi:hypothetical protein